MKNFKVLVFVGVLFVVLLSILFFSDYRKVDEYVPFVPMKINLAFNRPEDATKVDENIIMDYEFIRRLSLVLNFFKVDYRVEGDVILISKGVAEDKELLVNFTQKASDDAWISQLEKILDGSKIQVD